VCDLSPQHHLVTDAVQRARETAMQVQPIVFRDDRNSRRIVAKTPG
jgi:pyrroloquinoline quinone biosynthesis protein E